MLLSLDRVAVSLYITDAGSQNTVYRYDWLVNTGEETVLADASPICLSVCLNICMFVSVYLSIYLSTCLSTCVSSFQAVIPTHTQTDMVTDSYACFSVTFCIDLILCLVACAFGGTLKTSYRVFVRTTLSIRY